jgi:hypothetical protein
MKKNCFLSLPKSKDRLLKKPFLYFLLQKEKMKRIYPSHLKNAKVVQEVKTSRNGVTRALGSGMFGERADIALDTTKIDIFANPQGTVFWDSSEEQIKAQQTFAVGAVPGNTENAIAQVTFYNKVTEAADLYFKIQSVDAREDLIQSHLLLGPVRVPAAPSLTEPSVTSLGNLARRLGAFRLFWGIVIVPIPN